LEITYLVDNPFVTNIIGKAADCVRATLMELRESAAEALIFNDLEDTDKCHGTLPAATERGT
jgi:hypothetical protein